MAKGPKVTHPEYVDFNSDEDDLLGDDDLLVDNSSDENYDELCRMRGSGKPLRFEHWGVREVFPSYRSTL